MSGGDVQQVNDLDVEHLAAVCHAMIEKVAGHYQAMAETWKSERDPEVVAEYIDAMYRRVHEFNLAWREYLYAVVPVEL